MIEKTCRCAGAVKRDRLKICWLSAYEGSNPFACIEQQILNTPNFSNFHLRVKSIEREVKTSC